MNIEHLDNNFVRITSEADISGIEESKIIRAIDYINAIKGFEPIMFSSPVLPLATVCYKRNEETETFFIFEPEISRRINYYDDNFEIITPPLLARLKFSLEGSKRNFYRAEFLMCHSNSYPNNKTLLYYYPMPNISQGVPCLGSSNNGLRSNVPVKKIRDIISNFFTARMNDDYDESAGIRIRDLLDDYLEPKKYSLERLTKAITPRGTFQDIVIDN